MLLTAAIVLFTVGCLAGIYSITVEQMGYYKMSTCAAITAAIAFLGSLIPQFVIQGLAYQRAWIFLTVSCVIVMAFRAYALIRSNQ